MARRRFLSSPVCKPGIWGADALSWWRFALDGFCTRFRSASGFLPGVCRPRGILPYARTIFPLVLSLPSLLEQISYFLLFGLRTLDLLDVAEGRILGRGGQLHLELGENEVDACARAEAAYTADASRTADSTDTLTHTSPIS